jgi:enoyl-CoA hydratase
VTAEELREVRKGPILTLILNRPSSRNALTLGLVERLHERLEAFERDDELQVLILTGADPAFCAGVDLKVVVGSSSSNEPSVGDVWPLLPPMKKPVIGAVNGPAVTGGLELALGCTFLVASDRATFVDTHARVGVMPGWGMTVRLPELVGPMFARRMSITGEVVDADTALRAGLITEVVPHEGLLERASALAGSIVSGGAGSVQGILASYAATGTRHHDLVTERTLATQWRLSRAD